MNDNPIHYKYLFENVGMFTTEDENRSRKKVSE